MSKFILFFFKIYPFFHFKPFSQKLVSNFLRKRQILLNRSKGQGLLIISPNEVFGDIMVLASRLPVDIDNVKNIEPISFKLYMWVDTQLRYFAIEIWYCPITRTTAFAAKQHSVSPIYIKCNCPNVDTNVKYLNLYITIVNKHSGNS